MVSEGRGRIAHSLDVRRIFHERLAHRIHTVFESEFHAVVVVFGEGTYAEVDVRKVEPLARTQFTAHDDAAADIGALDLVHLDLDQTIVQIERVAGFHHLGEAGEGDGDPLRIANDVVGREREKVVRFQLYGFDIELPDAHLGTGQVRHDGETASGGSGGGSEICDHLFVPREITMGEIKPGNIHAGQQQLLHHGGGLGCGPYGAYDLGLVEWKSHGCPPLVWRWITAGCLIAELPDSVIMAHAPSGKGSHARRPLQATSSWEVRCGQTRRASIGSPKALPPRTATRLFPEQF